MENENVKALISKRVNGYINIAGTDLVIGDIHYEKLLLFIATLYEMHGLSPIDNYGNLLFSCTGKSIAMEVNTCVGCLRYHYTYYENDMEDEWLSQGSGCENVTIEEEIKAVEDEAKFVQIVKALKVFIQVHIKGNITL